MVEFLGKPQRRSIKFTRVDSTCITKLSINNKINEAAEVLAYLHVQVSPISCRVVGSILALLGKNKDTAVVGDRTPRPVLLTGAKSSPLGCLITFQLPMGFQNFVVINKIHPLKKIACAPFHAATSSKGLDFIRGHLLSMV